MKRVALKIMGTALAISLVSCGVGDHTESASHLKVTNGIAVSQSEYPAVAKLDLYKGWSGGICTGTWVNDHQLLTAAHCVYSKPKVSVGRVRALSYHIHDDYDIELNGGVNKYDLAIVNFPEGTAASYRSIASSTPRVGQKVEIVGFGHNVVSLSGGRITGTGSGKLRYGRNVLRTPEQEMLKIVGVPRPSEDMKGAGILPGEYVATGSGDSGGPIFVNGKLVGVTSGGGISAKYGAKDVALGLFTDLNSQESRAFLAKYLD